MTHAIHWSLKNEDERKITNPRVPIISRWEWIEGREWNWMMTSLQAPSPTMSLFGLNLSGYSRLVQFLLTSTAVLVFHVAQGYIQVWISAIHSMKAYLYCLGINSTTETTSSLSELFHTGTVRLFHRAGLLGTQSIWTIDQKTKVSRTASVWGRHSFSLQSPDSNLCIDCSVHTWDDGFEQCCCDASQLSDAYDVQKLQTHTSDDWKYAHSR